MKIKYTLKDFDGNKIIDKYGIQKGGNTQLWFANNCFRRMQKYVPFKSGALSTTVTVRSGSVTYEQKYAEIQFKTNKGKGIRGKQWHNRMITAERDVLTREAKKYMEMQKGNR